MTTPLKALIQERLRAKLGRHEEDAAGALEILDELPAGEPHRRNGNASAFARPPPPRSPEFQRHASIPLPRRFPIEVAMEDEDEDEERESSTAFLPRHRRPRTHRHHHHHHEHHHPHKHQQPLTRASAPEPRMPPPPPESPWGSSRKGMHPHRNSQLIAKDNGDQVRDPSLASERMNRSHQQHPPPSASAPAPRPRFEPYKSRYEYDQQQQRRMGYEERNPRPEQRYQNPVAKSSMLPPFNRPFRSSSNSQERARHKPRALGSHQTTRDLEQRTRDRSMEFAARSRVPEHRHSRVLSFRTVDTTAEVVAAYPRIEFPANPGMQLLEPAGPSPDARSQPRVRSYESILSPDSRLAAKAFVDKRRRRAGSSTPRTMATQRWLQSLDAPLPEDGRFFSPDIIL